MLTVVEKILTKRISSKNKQSVFAGLLFQVLFINGFKHYERSLIWIGILMVIF